MNYFKLIKDSNIIGAVNSYNFMRYLPITDCFVRANENTGEYISYNGHFYRSTWMQPIKQLVPFIDAQVIGIDEEEYDILTNAISNNEVIYNIEEYNTPEVETETNINPIDRTTLEFVKNSKINELSLTCRRTIEAGFDLELRGELHHFSLDTQDQLNLISLSAMAQTQELIPYHADGEECMFYTAAEINSIVAAATSFKIYHTTYYNALKNYVNALETIEEVSAITYGTPIPEEYQSDVLKTLAAE